MSGQRGRQFGRADQRSPYVERERSWLDSSAPQRRACRPTAARVTGVLSRSGGRAHAGQPANRRWAGVSLISVCPLQDTGAQDWAWASDISTIRSATAATGTAVDTATAVTAMEGTGYGGYQPYGTGGGYAPQDRNRRRIAATEAQTARGPGLHRRLLRRRSDPVERSRRQFRTAGSLRTHPP